MSELLKTDEDMMLLIADLLPVLLIWRFRLCLP